MQLSQQQQLSLLSSAPFASNANLPLHFPTYKEGVSYTKRVPNCQKCGQHGRKARLKGHKRVCPFKDCNCQKCQVVTERQKLMAEQIKTRRRQRKNTALNCQKQISELNAAALAGQLPYLNMFYKQMATQPTDENALPKVEQPPTSLPSHLDVQTGVQFTAPVTTINSTAVTSMFNGFQQQTESKLPSKIVGSPLSTIGTETSLSPQVHPRTQSFDYAGLNSGATGPTTFLNPQLFSSLISSAPSAAQPPVELTPPQSAGLVAPIPLNPMTTTVTLPTSTNIEQLAQLINLLCQQQQQQLFQQQIFPLTSQSAPQQTSLNDLLLYSGLIPELSPPPEESHGTAAKNGFVLAGGVSAASMIPKPNGFVDVCSV